MNRDRTLLFLRLAFSAVCGAVCLLLIAFWVRSYWWADSAISQPSTLPRQIGLISRRGRLTLIVTQRDPRSRVADYFPSSWRIESDFLTNGIRHPAVRLRPMWVYEADRRLGRLLIIPHWFPVLFFGAMATCTWLPWFDWRFSLRTLLIATTIVALLIGAIVYAVR
jgi:hypothetical protein